MWRNKPSYHLPIGTVRATSVQLHLSGSGLTHKYGHGPRQPTGQGLRSSFVSLKRCRTLRPHLLVSGESSNDTWPSTITVPSCSIACLAFHGSSSPRIHVSLTVPHHLRHIPSPTAISLCLFGAHGRRGPIACRWLNASFFCRPFILTARFSRGWLHALLCHGSASSTPNRILPGSRQSSGIDSWYTRFSITLAKVILGFDWSKPCPAMAEAYTDQAPGRLE
ncbi:hypothetical protein LZ30DRAFT_364840 [Colletotrichum cereale]|nr:hypothetical protein LZ30DRAFT_364840 [Colletotrichum cereale]